MSGSNYFFLTLPLPPLPQPYLASDQSTGRGHSPIHQYKIGLKFADRGPAHQNKSQIPLQLVPPIRKLPQASYPYLSEGRQTITEN